MFFAAVLISTAAFSQDEVKSPREILLEKADSYKRSRNYQAALNTYTQICEKYPGMEGFLSKDIEECKKKLVEIDRIAEKKRKAEQQKVVETAAGGTAVESTVHVKVEEPKLELSEQAFYVFPEGTSKDVTVECNGEWQVDYFPPWCDIIRQTSDYLSFKFSENLSGKKRSDAIRISSGDLHKSISVTQDPMPELKQEKCKVFFRTTPKNVEVTILDSHVYRDFASHSYDLDPGEHNVVFNKLGYEQLDTLLVIPEAQDNNMMILDIAMKPTFGVLSPEITLGDAHLLEGAHPKIVFTIDGNYIDLDNDMHARSFDSSEGVVSGALYKGGQIPLEEGGHIISAVAAGYKPMEEFVILKRGENISLVKELELITGELIFHDNKNAENADVYVVELGLDVGKVGDVIRLPAGVHTIRIHKDGYRCDSGDMTVEIKRNTLTEMKASMTRLVTCKVSTVNKMEEVRLDGDVIEFQAPVHVFPLEVGHEYDLEVSKEGHWPFKTRIKVAPSDTLIDLQRIWLEPLKPLTIRTNEPEAYIHLYKKDSIAVKKKRKLGKGESPKGPDYAQMQAPMGEDAVTLYVPKAKYQVEVRRKKGANKLAYRGNLNFSKTKDHFSINPRPKSNFLTIGGDYGLFRKPVEGVVNSADANAYTPVIGSLWFGQFRFIAPGLSTNVLKASLIDCTNAAVPEGLDPQNAKNNMLAASAMFINYDFRLGGTVLQYADINLLLSYSWYPDFTTLVPMSHVSGHEAFGGLELASRLKVINLNVRAGLQYFNGSRNYFQDDGKKMTEIQDKFVRSPFEQMMFVVTAGFSLGSKKANGRNVARIF